MATAPETSLQMSSSDLIKKKPLDYGGFGEVYLCYHVTLGHVALKTVYTGPLRSEDSKRSLLEEGNIMASLNHERVVKLLGVIMEDSDCSLVMELLPRGNLLVVLKKVNVPMSVKGRIILEILDGMVYLTERSIVHKDIKPENILVDNDFHIKIADLGLATCKMWSKLTKQESQRRSRNEPSAGLRGAGTLSYMAPEHLKSIHARSTEKSDVYSFAIVVWVILTGQEPYENARSEEHMSQCVINGDRPADHLIPEDTPEEIIRLMKRCWDHNHEQRPTFEEAYRSFLPLYMEKLEPYVEKDVCTLRVILLQETYNGPEELVESMKSLSVTNECSLACEHDHPAPLMSSDKSISMIPVEASIEDLHNIQYDPYREFIQADAREMTNRPELEEKLDRELQYHQYGSYNMHPEASNYFLKNPSNPFLPNYGSVTDNIARRPAQEVSSVHSWTKGEMVQPTSPEEGFDRLNSGLNHSINSSSAYEPHLHMSASTPSLPQFNQHHPPPQFDRQKSCLTYPVSDTCVPDVTTGCYLNNTKYGSQQDSASLFIQNASGIQIGSNNTMSIRSHGASSLSSRFNNGSSSSSIQESIIKCENHAVNEAHLELVRANIGSKWKICARRLGLSNVEIDTIDHDYHRDGLAEYVHQMLESWKMKTGSIGCTVGKLCRALDGIIEVDVILKMLELCSCSSSFEAQ
uniref:Receptor (TNFRSF)-interacting serine-threonine kinase 1, like n=3 Tax=Nothobranchius TaxID=28779 RepID=A0A1A8D297_NOTKA